MVILTNLGMYLRRIGSSIRRTFWTVWRQVRRAVERREEKWKWHCWTAPKRRGHRRRRHWKRWRHLFAQSNSRPGDLQIRVGGVHEDADFAIHSQLLFILCSYYTKTPQSGRKLVRCATHKLTQKGCHFSWLMNNWAIGQIQCFWRNSETQNSAQRKYFLNSKLTPKYTLHWY